ncbi:MAG: NAD(P)-dependent oxidoreductase [Chloroflexi bacterium]|nr:NAD(P)-dependent oxidoreductase [Chloroflexota bacterium]MCY3587544.1 NAD(P)-dependent oxidoreductase [Chloroflexota bacterium]MCY3685575.1 NAD(P)-dependent oxidoreductase [Chloroflexota bacterium]MDE2708477.1 NAD(P)-dependent oxidoreductase [Chloroflexota bacterium]
MPDSSRDKLNGFIGTGNIGNPMARNLIEAGHQLVIYDLRPEVMENLLELGAESAESCAEVASRCSTVFSSLPGPPEIEAAITSADGILAGASPGDVHVDLSSNSITTVRRLAQLEAAAGVSYIDAPVTGGVPGAESGTLTVLGSGDADAFERVRPLLDPIGSNIFHLGEAGAGCLFKLLNNVIILCGNQIVQEALVLGTKVGLDPEDLVEKLRLGTARPYMGLAPYLLGKRFDNPSFTLRLAEKDVSLAIEAARANQVPMPVANAAHQTYLRALSAGLGEQSFLATLQAIEAAAGHEIPTIQIEGGGASL